MDPTPSDLSFPTLHRQCVSCLISHSGDSKESPSTINRRRHILLAKINALSQALASTTNASAISLKR
ncbi:hypothetical protein E1A91_D01G227100v1 [Gossypium mustelinum]|uniref:Uncharacterized protein n=1 Tax=Gossypium mustelinum TaxID=34275 RepID=A0A5D2WAX4_GOSMU|nr:hypothetical protein E1A91_D01G227100v1 [Gossypium mustelinum]